MVGLTFWGPRGDDHRPPCCEKSSRHRPSQSDGAVSAYQWYQKPAIPARGSGVTVYTAVGRALGTRFTAVTRWGRPIDQAHINPTRSPTGVSQDQTQGVRDDGGSNGGGL